MAAVHHGACVDGAPKRGVVRRGVAAYLVSEAREGDMPSAVALVAAVPYSSPGDKDMHASHRVAALLAGLTG